MDKQGALYFKLVTGVIVLVLTGYALGRLWPGSPSYRLYSTRICEVGDGITVSGFVVRSESILYSEESPTFLYEEGRWIGGGQTVATTVTGALTTPRAGYLSYRSDGYESLLTPDFILGCKTEDLLSLSPQPAPDSAVGRVIHGQTWYFAAPGDFPQLTQGSTLSLTIEGISCRGTVLRTQELLVLECNSFAGTVGSLRRADAQINLSSFSAISLPPEAVYYENETTFVYVLRGAQARRKPVTIVRIEDDTLWVDPQDLPTGTQVILTETEITDGMVLK